MAVSFTESVKPHLTVLPFDYSERAKFLLPIGGTWDRDATCVREWKVFLSRDAVGLLVDLFVSERGDSVERLHPAEEVAGPADG